MSATNSITKRASTVSGFSNIPGPIANHSSRGERTKLKQRHKINSTPLKRNTPIPLWDKRYPKPYYGPYTPLGQSAQLPNQNPITRT